MPSLANSAAGLMSSLTWARAKGQVAQVVGGTNDPDILQAAADQITAVLQDWNTRRNWQFLQVQAPDIPIVSGTSAYDLPTIFKRPYAALLVIQARPLKYITRREFNLIRPFSQNSPSTPVNYTLYNQPSTGQIELLPANGINDTLKVWYYRPMVEGPNSDQDTLDILARFENYVLDAARARILGITGPVEKMQYWVSSAEDGFKKAVADDESIPDEDQGFLPRGATYGGPPPNSFAWVDWGW